MQVFKLYIKLFIKSIPTLAIYLGIFLAITIVSTVSMKDNDNSIFEESKLKIAYINHDEDSNLLQGLKTYLGNNNEFIEIQDTEEGMQDALFFREVTYILSIPDGFTEDFLSGKEPVLAKRSVPDSMDAANVDMEVNNYLNTARIYRNHMNEMSEKEIVENIVKDLNTEVKVDIYSNGDDNGDNSDTVLYYNYLVFAVLSILILGIGSIMITFTNLDIKRRNIASPISLINFQFQQIIAILFFAFICDSLLIISGFILSGDSILNITSLLFILNLFIFTIAALSIAYLVGSLVKSREATNGIANLVALGASFISGVFVPKEYLGETVIQIAKFTPAYWYTTGNELIGELMIFTWEHMSEIFGNMLIQFVFAIAIFAITMVINKKKSTEAA